ncbi:MULTISPECIES: thioredoxin [Thioalkalivibrio]|uniref:thioredoxin n=1 Tax=Thioalkalivibrio TaxID=106633 RepID=UPI00036A8E27|nr:MULTISPECIES: thioredoxin [Thioalkalivibrio]OOC48441.1 co-chaperone YbbN [Thioalkalivibrio versutus]
MAEAASATGDDILDVTQENFQQAVLDESHQRPVVVDFWAAWCGPCQQLMPLLQQLATQYAGKFRLAKVNSDEQQALAQQYGVRSLPTVMIFRHGKPADQFMGVQPEPNIRAMIDQYLEKPSDKLIEQAREQAKTGDVDGALATLKAALEEDPDNGDLRIELARALAQSGDPEAAETELAKLPLDQSEKEEAKTLRARLVFAKTAAGVDPQALAKELQTGDPRPEALEQMAAYAMLSGRAEEALGLYLQLMKQHRAYNDGAGQQGLLAAFKVLGDDHPLVGQYRRQMASLLY